MTITLLVILGWFLGAAPLLLVLHATSKRQDRTIAAMRANHGQLLAGDREISVEQCATAVAAAVQAERERVHGINAAKRERELKPVAARIY